MESPNNPILTLHEEDVEFLDRSHFWLLAAGYELDFLALTREAGEELDSIIAGYITS